MVLLSGMTTVLVVAFAYKSPRNLLKSIKMKQEGKSIKEIRHYIDEKYKEGYAKPTKTPMPL
jgi:Protein of unknown function with PCYCGC motif